MQFRNSSRAYGVISKSLHWLIAMLVVLAWLLGTFGDDFPHSAHAAVVFVHMSLGLAVLALLVARVLWRFNDTPPPPESMPLGQWATVASTLTHSLLYLLLGAVPVAGIVLQFARGHPLPLFGLLEIASPWQPDRAFARSVIGVHELLANMLVVVAGLHAAAAFVHHWVFHDRTLRRMLPGTP